MENTELVGTVKDHELRIRTLELTDATMTEQVKGLIKQLGNLTGWIKALVVMMFSALLGFFVWYVQTIPRK